MNNISISVLILCLLNAIPARTQIREAYFEQFSQIDGLQETQVVAGFQDRQGYLWFCQNRGIMRFDGRQWNAYKLETDKVLQGAVSIFQDKSGNLVVGGLYDLNKFNPAKNRFEKIPNTGNTQPGAYEVRIYLHEDSFGNTWWLNKTAGLICMLDQKTDSTVAYTISTFTNQTTTDRKEEFQTLATDQADHIWLTTNRGIYAFDYNSKKFVLKQRIETLFFDKVDVYADVLHAFTSTPGKLWFEGKDSSGFRLMQLDTKTNALATFNTSAQTGQSPDSIYTMLEDRAGHIWIGSSNGISLYNPASNSFKKYPAPVLANKTGNNYCYQIAEGVDNEYWVLSRYGLLHLATPTASLEFYKQTETGESGFYMPPLTSKLLIDNNKSVWISTIGYGLWHLDMTRSAIKEIRHSDKPFAYPAGITTSVIYHAPTRQYYIVSSSSLYTSNEQLQEFHPVKKFERKITAIAPDEDGSLWLGINDDGLYNFNPVSGNARKIANTNPVPAQEFQADFVLKDTRQNIWIGTNGNGVSYYDTKTNTWSALPYNHSDNSAGSKNGELDHGQVRSMIVDKEGTLWVGTNLGGLNKFNPSTNTFTTTFSTNPDFISVTSILPDSKDQIWTGSYLSGIRLWNKNLGAIKHITTEDGLLNNFVQQLQEDSKGNIWAATPVGISVIDPVDFSIQNYSYNNGLPKKQLLRLYDNYLPDNKNMIIPIVDGILLFDLNAILPNTDPPIVHIQSVKHSSKDGGRLHDTTLWLQNNASFTLAYHENRVEVNYTGIQFINPDLTHFKYRLVGYDKKWMDAGTARTVTYTNLSPGDYQFEVMAANSDGVWSKEPAHISFKITPPWWRTWWAYLLYIMLCLVIIIGFVNWRSANLRRQNKMLEQKVNARTAEVQQQKEELAVQRDDLKKSLNDLQMTQAQLIQSEKMASLGELTAGIAHEIQNPLNFVNNFSELSNELIGEMKEEMATGNMQEASELAENLQQNLEKINHHGKRADAIVKSMLQHSQKSSGQKKATDINALCDEYLRISSNGFRTKYPSFEAKLETNLEPNLPKANVVPQDIAKVIINVVNNACYAVNEKSKKQLAGYDPLVLVSTKKLGDTIEINVKDNGTGIPENIRDKIFQPFFTTKPTGQGTGLGLSLAYDIVKAHGGEINVLFDEDQRTVFSILLPDRPASL